MLSNFWWLIGAFKWNFIQKWSLEFFEAFAVYEEELLLWAESKRTGMLSKCQCPPLHTRFTAVLLYQYNSTKYWCLAVTATAVYLPLHSLLLLYSSDLISVIYLLLQVVQYMSQCAAIASLNQRRPNIPLQTQVPMIDKSSFCQTQSTIFAIFNSSEEIIGNVFSVLESYSFSEWPSTRVKLALKIYDSKFHQQCFINRHAWWGNIVSVIDTVLEEDCTVQYSVEFPNTLQLPGVPPHENDLKSGSPSRCYSWIWSRLNSVMTPDS